MRLNKKIVIVPLLYFFNFANAQENIIELEPAVITANLDLQKQKESAMKQEVKTMAPRAA